MKKIIIIISLLNTLNTFCSDDKLPYLTYVISVLKEKSLHDNVEETFFNVLIERLQVPLNITKNSKKEIEIIYKNEKFIIDKRRNESLKNIFTKIKPILDSIKISEKICIETDIYIADLLVSSLDSSSKVYISTEYLKKKLGHFISFDIINKTKVCKLHISKLEKLKIDSFLASGDTIIELDGIKSKFLTKVVIDKLLDSLTTIKVKVMKNYSQQEGIISIKDDSSFKYKEDLEKQLAEASKNKYINFSLDTGSILISNLYFLKYDFSKLIENIKSNNISKDIIIDLRETDGGLLTNIIYFCEQFSKKGDYLFSLKCKTITKDFYSFNSGQIKANKIKIIVDEKTVCGSELCAMILKLNLRNVLIIGSKTRGIGKVHFTDKYPLKSIYLKYNAGELILKNGIELSGNGIIPDIEYHGDDIIDFAKKLK